MTHRDLSAQAWVLLCLLALIWGGSFLSIRIALDAVPFVTSVAYRVGFAAVLLWLWVLARGIELPSRRLAPAFLVMGLLNNVIPFCLMAWGQLYIPTGLTAVFNASTAVFGAVVAAALLPDERMTARKAVGVGVGFAGVVVAIGWRSLVDLDVRSVAQLAVVAGALSYAIAAVWARVRLAGVAPEASAAGMLTGSSVVMIPAALLIDGVPVWPGVSAALAVSYYVIAATAGAYVLYYRVLAMAGSANTMLVTLLVVPVSIGLGALVRCEALAPRVFVGMALLALGLVVLDGRALRWMRRPERSEGPQGLS